MSKSELFRPLGLVCFNEEGGEINWPVRRVSGSQKQKEASEQKTDKKIGIDYSKLPIEPGLESWEVADIGVERLNNPNRVDPDDY
jgi:hypothetical protein